MTSQPVLQGSRQVQQVLFRRHLQEQVSTDLDEKTEESKVRALPKLIIDLMYRVLQLHLTQDEVPLVSNF